MNDVITLKIPSGFMNLAVSDNNRLVGDTNDSQNWDTLSIPLAEPPKGRKWVIWEVDKGYVTLRLADKKMKTAVVSICEHYSKHHYHTILTVPVASTWKDCLFDALGESYQERINDLSDVLEEAQLEMWENTQITFDVSFIM
jgi:hypothetical protein